MKKLSAISSAITYFISATIASAQITIGEPTVNDQPVGYNDIGDFITKALTLAFLIAVIVVLVMLVWGAIEWIFSGGQKEAVANARGRILNALIGFAILAVAVAIAKLAAQFLGFPDITNTTFLIPHPGP